MRRRRSSAVVERVEVAGGVAGDLRQRGGVRAGDRDAALHRLQHRQPEALGERREDEAASPPGRGPRGPRPQTQPRKRDAIGDAELAGPPPGARPRRASDSPGRTSSGAGSASSRAKAVDQPGQVLVGPPGGDGEHHRRVAQGPGAREAPRSGVAGPERPATEVGDVDPLRGDAQHLRDLGRRRLRDA